MTSTLHLSRLTMPTAPVGPPNPLPPLFGPGDAHQVSEPGDADEEMLAGVGYGRVASVLPYLLQDGYGRTLTETEHEVAVLENEVLRATFLLGAGGRLASLVHRPSDRELLFRNPAFQPANLALRDAWVSGGVEWNIATIGHSPLTCEPLHAVRAQHTDGSPVLRMYEYERLRGVAPSSLPLDDQRGVRRPRGCGDKGVRRRGGATTRGCDDQGLLDGVPAGTPAAPSSYSKGLGSPAPIRTISGTPLVRSTTVVGV